MNIINMPETLADFLNKKGLLIPKECFNNCMGALIQMISKDDYEVNYVLCDIQARDGSVLEHAILKVNGEYIDPTLEIQQLHRKVDYLIHREFTTEEVMKLMIAKFGLVEIKQMLEGSKPVWPLSRVGDGQYEFVDA